MGAYICIPYAFLRQKIIQSLEIDNSEVNDALLYLLFHYHNIISSILFMIGGILLLIKLNRGFVKYQMRRTLWTTVSLIYVFMLSTVQIYNLY